MPGTFEVDAADEVAAPAGRAAAAVAAVPPHPDPLADPPRHDPGAERVDPARHLVPRHRRVADAREGPVLDEGVAVADAAGLDPHPHLPGTGLGDVPLDQLERRARLGDLDDAHLGHYPSPSAVAPVGKLAGVPGRTARDRRTAARVATDTDGSAPSPARRSFARSSSRKERRAPSRLPATQLQLGCGDVPVGPAFLENGTQVLAQLFDRRTAEEPVAHVDLVNDQPRLEHDHVRDHRIVHRIGVFSDVEVLLDHTARVGQERPVGAYPGPELVGLDDVVRADRDQPAVSQPRARDGAEPTLHTADDPWDRNRRG